MRRPVRGHLRCTWHRNRTVKGHALVWHNQLPAYVKSLSASALRSALVDHIQTVVSRYHGDVTRWDVVNEAFDDGGPTLRNSVFLQKLGEDYIELAFRTAAATDPNAELIYNDFNMLNGGPKADAVYEMVRDVRRRGVPIDAVGFQSRIGALFNTTTYGFSTPRTPSRTSATTLDASGPSA